MTPGSSCWPSRISRCGTEKAKEEAIRRGINWCLGMQSKNGGWGAFDKDNTKHLLNKIPFADLEALIDPPTADLTGRMLELMGAFDYSERVSCSGACPGVHQENPGTGRPLVGTLGSELHLRHLVGISADLPPSVKT